MIWVGFESGGFRTGTANPIGLCGAGTMNRHCRANAK